MTQHEYIFIAISIVLGLAMARLLHSAALLVRAHRRVTFHWSTTLWGICIFIYIMQLWWVGWELRLFADWTIVFLRHSRTYGRVSAASMAGYFAVGPYVNLTMFDNPPIASYGFPALGASMMALMIVRPAWFKPLSVVFTAYTILILYLTA